jgi:poly(3-hydroxybutyrate) depolymerase
VLGRWQTRTSIELADLGPGDHKLVAWLGGHRRVFGVHVPEAVDRRLLPVMAFDGVTVLNPKGSMRTVNGIDDASDRHKFAAIYPIPRTRYLGTIAGWNALGGFLSYRTAYDDVDYISEICRVLRLDKIYAVGFSAGGQFAHVLAGRLFGVIAGVVSVGGTWLGVEPPPARGTAALIIHGEDDSVLPYIGGVDSVKLNILVWLGNRHITSSRPDRQVLAYATANGYSGQPTVVENKYYVHRSFQPAGSVRVEEYVIRRPFGGHTYHGRKTGRGTESLMSRSHGSPLPPVMLSVNELLAGLLRDRAR